MTLTPEMLGMRAEAQANRIRHLEQHIVRPEIFDNDVDYNDIPDQKEMVDLMHKVFGRWMHVSGRPWRQWIEPIDVWRIAPTHVPLYIVGPSRLFQRDRMQIADGSRFSITLRHANQYKTDYTYIDMSFASALVQDGVVQHGLVSQYDRPSHAREDFGFPIAAVTPDGKCIKRSNHYLSIEKAVMLPAGIRLSSREYPGREFAGFVVMSPEPGELDIGGPMPQMTLELDESDSDD
jgi:hypothetical protein